MRSISLVALDMDGTLLDPGETVNPTLKGYLRELSEQKNVVLTICTGRNFQDTVQILDSNNLGAGTGIFSHLILQEREIWHLNREAARFYPRLSWNSNQRRVEKEQLIMVQRLTEELYSIFDQHGSWHRPREHEEEQGYVVVWFDDHDNARQIQKLFSDRLLEHRLPMKAIRNGGGVHLRHHSVGKGPVLSYLVQRLSVPAAEVLTVGDSQNDWDMLDGNFGFTGCTTSNADPEIIELVRSNWGMVAQSSFGEGVLEILSSILP